VYNPAIVRLLIADNDAALRLERAKRGFGL
jgi:hypothetical protein